MKKKEKRESFFEAAKKMWIALVIPLFIFGTLNLYKLGLAVKNGKKDIVYGVDIPPRPSLSPREIVNTISEAPVQGTMLGESEAVGEEYFVDAVFVGDSLTEGWTVYEMSEGFSVIAKRGLSPVETSVLKEIVYTTPEGEGLILADAIRYIGARKAYIMLGSNGLNYASPEDLIAGYSVFLDDLILKNPDTYIILQSVFPVTSDAAANKWEGRYHRDNVDYYNSLIRNLALDKGVYFMDTYSVLAGEDGYLLEEVTSGIDGMHINIQGYRQWLEYAKTHTVKGTAAVIMSKDGLLIPVGSNEDRLS